jgi:phosphoglycolate phosphatase-like HAD superfamily hydrolase
MIKAVIFDFDDTLVESREIKWAHHRHVAKKFYDIDLKDETLHKHWGKPLYTLISELYQNSDSLENMYDALISTRHDFLKGPYKGSAETVEILINHGLKIGVLSATNKKYLIEDLIRLGFLVDHLAVIQGADETLVHKPDPDVFLPVLKKLKEEGIGKEDIVYVGDSLDDMQAAEGAGIGFIAVTTGLYSEEDFRNHGVKVIMKDIKELPDLIKNL